MYSRDRLEKTNFSESKRRGESLGRGPANMRPAAWHNLSPRMRVCPLAGPRPRQVASGPALAADAGCAALHCPAGASAAGASALLVLGASAWWDCGPVNHKSSRLLGRRERGGRGRGGSEGREGGREGEGRETEGVGEGVGEGVLA